MDFTLSGSNRLMDFQDADMCMRSIEVIGNKYENPELLSSNVQEASK